MKYFMPALIVLVIVALLLMFLQKSSQTIQCPMAKNQVMAKNEDIKGLEI